MAECPRCGRPLPTGYPAGAATCVGGSGCKRIAYHYQRGLAAGVALAKRTATAFVVDDFGAEAAEIDWTETDAELRRGGGG